MLGNCVGGITSKNENRSTCVSTVPTCHRCIKLSCEKCVENFQFAGTTCAPDRQTVHFLLAGQNRFSRVGQIVRLLKVVDLEK